jgi:C1A family cysteine protease
MIGKNGLMPMPKPTEKRLGGHAVMAVGYDDAKQVFLVRNSWSKAWGDQGYFYMPYFYITDTNRADDFWTIRLVEKGLTLRSSF